MAHKTWKRFFLNAVETLLGTLGQLVGSVDRQFGLMVDFKAAAFSVRSWDYIRAYIPVNEETRTSSLVRNVSTRVFGICANGQITELNMSRGFNRRVLDTTEKQSVRNGSPIGKSPIGKSKEVREVLVVRTVSSRLPNTENYTEFVKTDIVFAKKDVVTGLKLAPSTIL